jgi:hypothetical protein
MLWVIEYLSLRAAGNRPYPCCAAEDPSVSACEIRSCRPAWVANGAVVTGGTGRALEPPTLPATEYHADDTKPAQDVG